MLGRFITRQDHVFESRERLPLAAAILIGLYVSGGVLTQLLLTSPGWHNYPPIIMLAVLATLASALFCAINAVISIERRLARVCWIGLGGVLTGQALYEWLSIRQIVGDEDAFVIFTSLCAALMGSLLLELEGLSPSLKKLGD